MLSRDIMSINPFTYFFLINLVTLYVHGNLFLIAYKSDLLQNLLFDCSLYLLTSG